MVKINKIYTKSGDAGETGLVTGERISKSSVRVEAYGTVDEANATLGVALIAATRLEGRGTRERRIADALAGVQHDLFDAGADLATPREPDEAPDKVLRILPEQTQRLEALIDSFNANMAPLNSFVLPGGSELSAALHVARTVVRRAERVCVQLAEAEPESTSPEVGRYLNRLSDLLFVLARTANRDGQADVLWEPGATRPHAAP